MVLGVVRVIGILLSGTIAQIKPHDHTWNGLGTVPAHAAAAPQIEDDEDHDENQRAATLHLYLVQIICWVLILLGLVREKVLAGWSRLCHAANTHLDHTPDGPEGLLEEPQA